MRRKKGKRCGSDHVLNFQFLFSSVLYSSWNRAVTVAVKSEVDLGERDWAGWGCAGVGWVLCCAAS